MEEITMSVQGMTCAMCEQRVEGALTERAGVQAVEAEAARDRVRVTYDPEKITREELREAVRAAGYAAADDG